MFAQKQQTLPAYIGSLGMFTDTKTIFFSYYDKLHVSDSKKYIIVCVILTHEDGNGICQIVGFRIVDCSDERGRRRILYKACDLVLREFEKINGKFASIGLVKFHSR